MSISKKNLEKVVENLEQIGHSMGKLAEAMAEMGKIIRNIYDPKFETGQPVITKDHIPYKGIIISITHVYHHRNRYKIKLFKPKGKFLETDESNLKSYDGRFVLTEKKSRDNK